MNLNMLLFSDKYATEKDIKKYSNLQELDNTDDNYVTHLSKEQKTELATYIHDNYGRMDEQEMKCIAMKCLDLNEIKEILLSFEFVNYRPESKEMTLNKFIKEAMKMFDKYYRIGGTLIEDEKWIVHKSDSNKFEVSEHEVLFHNTIDNMDVNDGGIQDYLGRLVKNLNRIAPNVDVVFDIVEKKKITYLLIWGKLNNVKDECIVGL